MAIISNFMICELQIYLNVLEALIGVISMQLATTLKGVTSAIATLDM